MIGHALAGPWDGCVSGGASQAPKVMGLTGRFGWMLVSTWVKERPLRKLSASPPPHCILLCRWANVGCRGMVQARVVWTLYAL